MVRAGVDAPGLHASRMYRELGIGLVQLLRANAAPAPRAAGVDAAGVDTAALDTAGPLVIFASHTRNWELAAAGAAKHLATRGRALHVVAKPMHSAFFDRVLRRIRARLGVRVIAPAGALAHASAAVARGDVVAMPIDQVPDLEAHGLWLDFLGAPALVDRAPATVAWRMRATVLVVAGGEVLDVIPPPSEGEPAKAWVRAATARATAALERFVRAEPASWMWLHRRWKRPALVAPQPRD